MPDRVDELVDLLDCSIAEAQSIIDHDNKIDKGFRTEYDLSKEQEKKALKYANATEHKKPVTIKKEKKIDESKKSIIDLLFGVVADKPKAKITNPHKTIVFIDENSDIYTINLIKATPKTYNKVLKELD